MADIIRVGELGGWETGQSEVLVYVISMVKEFCMMTDWVSHGQSRLKWSGCGGQWSWRGQRT